MRKYRLTVNGKEVEVQLNNLSADEAELEINGKDYRVAIGAVSEVIPEGALANLQPTPAKSLSVRSAPPSSDDGTVIAPIPGSMTSSRN